MKSFERRDQLLRVATNLFSQKGFHGTTTKEISRAAEVTEALIFRYFPTKEHLYRTVIEEYVETSRHPEWHNALRSYIEKNDDEGLFRKLIELIFSVYRQDTVMQRLLVYATLEGYHQEADRACHLPKDLVQEIIAYIARRQSEGALEATEPSAAFRAIFGMARSYAVAKYVYKLKELKMTDDKAAEFFLSFAMKALRPEIANRTPKKK